MGERRRAVRRWLRKGSWAVLDQGLFATSNFAVNILLARWLAPEEYGAFGVAFALYLFVGNLHQATLIEPMLVYGQGRYKERLSEYLGTLVYGHLGFAALASVALAFAGLGFAQAGQAALSSALLALALAGPFILLLWLVRRACYARLEPRLAAAGGAWYMVLMLAAAFGLYWSGWISTAAALAAMGASSLVVSLWLLARLRVEWPPLRGGDLLRDSLGSHWRYGRWSVVNKGLSWVPQNIFFLLVAGWVGLEAGASYRALMILLLPWSQALTSLTSLLLPTFVRAREEPDFPARVRSALAPFVLGAVLYWLLLGVFHNPVVELAYGGKYAENAGLLWLLAFALVFGTVKEVLAQAVKAIERPDRLFVALVFSAVVAGASGMLCVSLWGMPGAGVALVLSQAIAATLVAASFVSLCRRGPSGGTVLAERREAG